MQNKKRPCEFVRGDSIAFCLSDDPEVRVALTSWNMGTNLVTATIIGRTSPLKSSKMYVDIQTKEHGTLKFFQSVGYVVQTRS